MNGADVRAGYTQTEVGVIPEDWDVRPLSSLLSFPVQNGVFNEPVRKGRGCKLINVIDLYTAVPIDTSNLERFDASRDEISRFGVAHGDLFFTRSSLTPDGIAHCNIYNQMQQEDLVFDCHIIRARANTNKIDPFFLARYCTTRPARKYLVTNAKTTTMTTVDQGVIANLPVPLPSTMTEQRAIAAALSDVDALISELDQLITKKRDLKQATMQQLLTGQRRLPGFGGAWEIKRIGEFTDCTAGGTPSTSNPAYWGGHIRWMSSGELNLKYVYEVEGRITELGLRNSSATMIPKRCILIGLAGQGKTRGTVAMNMVDVCTNQSIAAIFPSPSFVSSYLYYNLDFRYEELRSLSTGGGGRGGLNLTIIKSLLVPFPPKDEQAAIATVLSDMDAEIAALESRRAKTSDLKQGMMQELLTGKTRLVGAKGVIA